MKPIVVWLCCLTLIAALLFGGAASQGLAADGIAEFVGLILFALAAPLAGPALARTPSAFALLVGLAILPCLQLIPLPDWLWSALPGRQPVMDIFAAAHVKPGWRPASLIPGATLRTLLSLLPATAIFLAALTLDAGDRMKLFWTVIAVGALSVPIAMLQVLGGDNGPYFYAITNIGNGVGFFANSNHFADLEYLLAPLCAVAVIAAPLSAGAARNTIAAGLTAILLFGMALSGSRTAFILGLPAVALTLALLLRPQLAAIGRAGRLWLAGGAIVVVLPVMLGLGLLAIFHRTNSQGLIEGERWPILTNSWTAAMRVFPVGAGFGTFPGVYPVDEPESAFLPETVNHAHNDALETLLEGGVFAPLLTLAFLGWLILATRRALVRAPGPETGQARAGLIVIWLLLAHSLWDYPLRTIALESLFAICVAMQFAPPPLVASPSDNTSWPPPRKR